MTLDLEQVRALPSLDHVTDWVGLRRSGNYGDVRDDFPEPLGGCQHIATGYEDRVGEDSGTQVLENWLLHPDNTVASWSHHVDSDSAGFALPDTVRAWAQGDGRDTPYIDYNEALVGQEIVVDETDWRDKPDWYVEKVLRMSASMWALWFVRYDWPIKVTTDRGRLVELLRRGESPGLVAHHVISPEQRMDPGMVDVGQDRLLDTFPWDSLLEKIHEEKAIRVATHEEESMARSMNGLTVLDNYPPTAGRFWSPGAGFKEVYARNRPFAVLFEAIARRWHNNVGPIAASHPDNWKRPRERHGYNKAGKWDAIGIHVWRPPGNVGIGNLSNHRSASAVDINGHLHPWKSTPGTDNLSSAQKAQIRRIRTDFTDGSGRTILSLGIDYPLHEYDPMHIEVATGVSEARVAQAAAKLENYVGRSSTFDVWWREAKGMDVFQFQEQALAKGFAISSVDGIAGPNTEAVVRAVQRAGRVEVDGKVGPATRAALASYRPPAPEPPAPPPIPDMSAHRLYGEDRYRTSVEVSKHGWTPATARSVYLVNGTSLVDQSVAASLTGGPILLVREDSIPGSVRAEIARLAPRHVFAVGGPISDKVIHEARKSAGLEK